MKKNVSKQFLDIYGIGLKTSLNFHKKIGLNSRKSPLKLKKNQQNYFKNQLFYGWFIILIIDNHFR